MLESTDTLLYKLFRFSCPLRQHNLKTKEASLRSTRERAMKYQINVYSTRREYKRTFILRARPRPCNYANYRKLGFIKTCDFVFTKGNRQPKHTLVTTVLNEMQICRFPAYLYSQAQTQPVISNMGFHLALITGLHICDNGVSSKLLEYWSKHVSSQNKQVCCSNMINLEKITFPMPYQLHTA